ncbi:MAG: MATE family efflux transporter, partial [Clostridia bacterium]|nr:MATE family efflux transporter [Clostridia bacterium]
LLKLKNRPFERLDLGAKPDRDVLGQIIKWVSPISIESFLFTFLSMLTATLVASYGANAMASSRVGSQIESLTWLISGGFASALTAFVGQNYGAHKPDRIDTAFRTASAAMLCYGAAITLLLAIPGKYIFALFLPDPELVERSVLYLRIMAICQIPMCMEVVSSNTFRGIGKTVPPAVINTTCNVLRVPLVYLLSSESFGFGLSGVWIGITVSACIKGCWSYAWYLLSERNRKPCDG